MGLDIQDEDTANLARELARRLGTSVAEAVAAAVREKLHRLREPGDRDARLQRALEIGRTCAAHLPADSLRDDPSAWLYDEEGRPRMAARLCG